LSSDRRENPEQIPSSHNQGETKAMASEQARIEWERKEVDVKDYPKAAAIAQVLKDLEFQENYFLSELSNGLLNGFDFASD
jgi:hypothetical protein